MQGALFPRASTILIVAFLATPTLAEKVQVLEPVEVIGVTPVHGVGLPEAKIPYAVQSASGADLERFQSLDLTDFINRRLGSVNLNAAQNNPLQPDVQYRGFTASPLLGLPQGLAVYQNGVRIQEPFGDTVNWELIPESAIASINLIGGANPLFGLNTLGGTLSIRTKTGFTHPGHQAEIYGGSFGRVVAQAESGWHNGRLGYFTTFNYFDEEGWRDLSDSDVKNFFATLGWHGDNSTAALSFSYGDSELRGNGPLPVQLLDQDRETIFTAPDITENDLKMVILEGSHWFEDSIQLSVNAFCRDIDTDSFNGDGTEFDECAGTSAATAGLVEPEEFRCENAGGDDEEPVVDQFGVPVGVADDAINNLSTRSQRAYGGALQETLVNNLLGHENQLLMGAAWNQGLAEFASQVEIASLNPDRSTSGTGRLLEEQGTRVKTRTRTWSLFISDTLSVTPDLHLTFSGRFNSTRVAIRDLSGDEPELNGDHDFDRFNPAGGVSWQAHPLLNVYASYSESTRAPTPVELVCADEQAPCNLPNAFLADPPLQQVVAKSGEGGFRGDLSRLGGLDIGEVQWNLAGFHTLNEDDIIFQATGGVTANEGFFANVGDTRRLGLELALDGGYGRVNWFLNYSYVEATFRDPLLVNSPSHPLANVDGDIAVEEGDTVPGIPRHQLKLGVDVGITPSLNLGGDVMYNSGQFLRGDEANLLHQTDAFAVLNLRGEYRVTKHLALFARIENIFDTDYETFGLLGEPTAVLGPAFDDPRFLSPGAERGGWIGVRLSL